MPGGRIFVLKRQRLLFAPGSGVDQRDTMLSVLQCNGEQTQVGRERGGGDPSCELQRRSDPGAVGHVPQADRLVRGIAESNRLSIRRKRVEPTVGRWQRHYRAERIGVHVPETDGSAVHIERQFVPERNKSDGILRLTGGP
jgi:hypothetical protein